MTSYLDLRIGAKRRLEILRNAAKTYPTSKTWRDVRYATHKSPYGFDQGFNDNGKTPIWYSHGGPDFRREKWADECENVRIDHTGWFADIDGAITYRGFIIALSHGRFIGGYCYTDNDERVYFPDLFDDERDAAYFADGRAEWYAKQEREYREHESEARQLNDKIETKLQRLRECLALRNNKCFGNLRAEAARLVDSIRTLREKLATDYADVEIFQ